MDTYNGVKDTVTQQSKLLCVDCGVPRDPKVERCSPCRKVYNVEQRKRLIAEGVVRACSRCHEEKPYADFGPHALSTNGTLSVCRACLSLQDIARKLKAPFSVVKGMKDKATKCGICDRQLTIAAEKKIDHCGVSGQLRDVLCNTCNLGLGNGAHNPYRMKNLQKYVKGDRPWTRRTAPTAPRLLF